MQDTEEISSILYGDVHKFVDTPVGIAYDEVVFEMFGTPGEIRLRDNAKGTEVLLKKDSLKRLYDQSNLSKSVIKKTIKAHATILKYGIKTGNERVIVLDCKTGKKVTDKTGTSSRVVFELSQNYKGELIAIHNHPSSVPFSPIDLNTFGSYKQIRFLVVQGHDGSVYALRKTVDVDYFHTERSLSLVLTSIATNPKYIEKTDVEIGKIFIKMIANVMKWEFVFGGKCNE